MSHPLINLDDPELREQVAEIVGTPKGHEGFLRFAAHMLPRQATPSCSDAPEHQVGCLNCLVEDWKRQRKDQNTTRMLVGTEMALVTVAVVCGVIAGLLLVLGHQATVVLAWAALAGLAATGAGGLHKLRNSR